MTDSVKSALVVVGDQGPLAVDAGGPVAPDAGGEGEKSLGDAGEHALVGSSAVVFQVELALQGLVDRLDPLPHTAEVAVGVGLVAAVQADQPQSDGILMASVICLNARPAKPLSASRI